MSGATATPITPDEAQKMAQDMTGTVEDVINSFSDKIPEEEECTSEEAQKAKGILNGFMDYVKSEGFKEDVNQKAKEFKVPPKQIAKNFFTKALGIIGDVLGIGISTIGNVATTVIDIVSAVLKGGVNLIMKVANGLARMVTLNQTAVTA